MAVSTDTDAEHMRSPLAELRASVMRAAALVTGDGGSVPAEVRVERPKRAGQGDYSTNLAMLLAPVLRAAPRDIAERVGETLTEVLGDDLVRFEVAGPGFVNLFLSDAWYRRSLRPVLGAGQGFGADGAKVSRRVLVE